MQHHAGMLPQGICPMSLKVSSAYEIALPTALLRKNKKAGTTFRVGLLLKGRRGTPVKILSILVGISFLASIVVPPSLCAGQGVVGNRIGNSVVFTQPLPPVDPNQLPMLPANGSWTGVKNFQASGAGGTVTVAGNPTGSDWSGGQYNQLVIYQNAPQAIIDWATFNIGSAASVYFNQQGNKSWTALNRIWDANPSQIFGTLKADGSIYLINQNGILFGPGAQVDVHTLIASSLNMTNDDFTNGLLQFEEHPRSCLQPGHNPNRSGRVGLPHRSQR
jgi:filamentous hemagglutinin family protein